MRNRIDRHLQLSLRLADPEPAVVPDGKQEELNRAIIDLLLEAVGADSATRQAPARSDHER